MFDSGLIIVAEDVMIDDEPSIEIPNNYFLRVLVLHWAQMARIICADSYFVSLQLTETLLDMGFKFSVVKKSCVFQSGRFCCLQP